MILPRTLQIFPIVIRIVRRCSFCRVSPSVSSEMLHFQAKLSC